MEINIVTGLVIGAVIGLAGWFVAPSRRAIGLAAGVVLGAAAGALATGIAIAIDRAETRGEWDRAELGLQVLLPIVALGVVWFVLGRSRSGTAE